MDFSKVGQARIEQLRDELNKAAQLLGFVLPSQSIQWIPELEVIRFTNAVDGVDAQIDVEALALQYQTQVQNIIDAHIPVDVYFKQEKEDAYIRDLSAIQQQAVDLVLSLEGVSITDMTLAQLKTLLFSLAFKAGAINPSNMTIRDPREWVK